MNSADLIDRIVPENELERRALADPLVRAGLRWGKPRRGHPEGPVAAHVIDLLERIDDDEQGSRRADLRLIAILHDALKHRVRDWLPHAGSNHHGLRARRFAESLTDDERLLATIELHDRPYALWRRMRRSGRLNEAAFDAMIARIPDPDLFLRFVELDGSTEGKKPEPVRWFRQQLEEHGALRAGAER